MNLCDINTRLRKDDELRAIEINLIQISKLTCDTYYLIEKMREVKK